MKYFSKIGFSHLFSLTISLGVSLLAGLPAHAAGEAAKAPAAKGTATAIFAGGCFWCIEKDFEKLPGVLGAESGYTAGKTPNPTYEQVSAGETGHAEVVRVTYDPSKVSYSALLEYFWRHIDPTVKDRQFCDSGTQYRSGVYYGNESERAIIEASKANILKAGRIKQIQTEIAPASQFYPAEDYHQDYYKKNPVRYNLYRLNCGRDARVAEVWGKS
jgi:peptide-methionine (S)-S-oxide reductase